MSNKENNMEFYIGEENASGIKAKTKEEFFRYLDDAIEVAKERNQKYFTITIENEE